SASVAAADAPASPLPTTITSNFRLFAGLTNFKSKRCLSHFCAIGPEGIFPSSCILLECLLSVSEKDGEGNRGITQEDKESGDPRKRVEELPICFILPP